jgi:hemolysin activation/secretion protein
VIYQGIDDYGAFASPTQSVAPALSFTTATLGFIHVKALSPLWQLRCDFDGQWASQDLPAAERFTFGGARFGKAFDPAELIGDSGAALSLQIIRQVGKRTPWLEASRVYMQADYGYAYDNYERISQEAASITAGISGRVAALLASLELSQALKTANDEPLGHPRAFFYLQTQF